jgi:ABC-type Fe3+-hydroxamate transport system substrate-binding protein
MPELATALTRDFRHPHRHPGDRVAKAPSGDRRDGGGVRTSRSAGRALVAFLDEDRRRIEAKFRGRLRRSLLLVLDRGQTGLFVAGPGSFLDGLFASAGLANAAASASGPWASPAAEALSELAPDAILDLSIGEGERGRLEAAGFWKRFSHFPAVASGRVVVARGRLSCARGRDSTAPRRRSET